MFAVFILLILSLHPPEPRSFAAAQQDECLPASCDASGPMVRFPFHLTGFQPERCGYPGFGLSCGPDNRTEFDFLFSARASAQNIALPLSAKARVREIDYRNQVIRVNVLNGSCLPNRVPKTGSPAPPFELHKRYRYVYRYGYTLFNCSGMLDSGFPRGPITCLGRGRFQVYAVASFYTFTKFSPSNCMRMYNISDIPGVFISGQSEDSVYETQLHWPNPVCRKCEANGMYCRLRSNNETECFETKGKKGISKYIIIAIVLVGVSLTMLGATLLPLYNAKKREEKNKRRIDKFLEDYRALRPTRYTYSDVKRMTEGFKHQLGRGGYGTVFKGKLSSDIPVAVKILNSTKGNGDDFINEVATIGRIHHVNVVRLVGYCADGYRRALVYEFLENGSLDKYVSSGSPGSTGLGWEKLPEIAVGIAEGIDYLHWGCNQRILHFDIKPHNILLDGNLSPKVADFGLAKLCSKEQSVATMTARGTIGYIAPEVFSRNFGRVSYKSDIYSYGMLLLDMVGGRRNFDAQGVEDGCSSEVYFPEWMYNQLEKGKDIVIQIGEERESEEARRLIIVGLWCIQWYPADRPSMKVVVQMLRGDKMPVMPPNPFAPSKSVEKNLAFDRSSSSSGTSLSCRRHGAKSES